MDGMDLAKVVDVDWKFGVTVSSSENDEEGSTFLHLKLTLQEGRAMRFLYLELSLQQFYELLHKLNRAKQALEVSSTVATLPPALQCCKTDLTTCASPVA
eukprot:GGOE01004342.1.p2 GENE.GGOE01004342.1~~GGOE01004342.1.p2  ORF type:complete len:100 (-),score=32.53 GGOE01004342.1:211-510(-)